MTSVGILGATGEVGAPVAHFLAEEDVSLRLGSRNEDSLRTLRDSLPTRRVETQQVDITDDAQLSRFLTGLDVLVNCTAPSARHSAAVATAARSLEVDYVDPSGGRSFIERLRGMHTGTWTAVFQAGMMPGLSGIILRHLADTSRPRSLRLWHGGLLPVSRGSAADLLLDRGGGTVARPKVRRSYRKVPGSAAGTVDNPPVFPRDAQTFTFVGDEVTRVCERYAIPDAEERRVGVGRHVEEVARYYASSPVEADETARLEEAVDRFQSAVSVDLIDNVPSYAVAGEASTGDSSRRLAVTTSRPFELTGLVSALAVRTLLTRGVPCGVSYVDELIDPSWCLEQVDQWEHASSLTWLDGDTAVDEGEIA